MPSDNTPSPAQVREQIARLGRSAQFSGSGKLFEFLSFIIEETLYDGGTGLKESTIGNAVYGREPPYDPRIHSTVRVEARRLRDKLRDYFAADGKNDPVHITLPTGGYVPTFALNVVSDPQADVRADAEDDAPLFHAGKGAAVAVMPFHALSGHGEDEAFADGLTDELIFALERVQGLRLTSRSIVFQYKNRPYSVPGLATELGVDAVLQGTIRRDGDMLRATIEVSNPQGFVMWTDRFDARDDARMQLQEKIAQTLLSRSRLDSSLMRSFKISPGPNALDALSKVYRARQLLDRQTRAALWAALDLFTQVSEEAPSYARGYAGIADCYCDLFRLGLIGHGTASQKAKAAATQALQIDPRSSEAQTALATIAAWFDRDPVAAGQAFEDALALGESARAARIYGVMLAIFGRHDDAERLLRSARAIEPFSAQQDIAETISYYEARRYARVLALAAESQNSGEPSAELLVYKALALIFSDDGDAARSLLPAVDQQAAKYPDQMFAGAEIAAWLGETERGLKLIESSEHTATHFARATLAAALQKDDLVFSSLDAAIDRRELSTVWLRSDVRFDRYRASRRFDALVDRLKPQP